MKRKVESTMFLGSLLNPWSIVMAGMNWRRSIRYHLESLTPPCQMRTAAGRTSISSVTLHAAKKSCQQVQHLRRSEGLVFRKDEESRIDLSDKQYCVDPAAAKKYVNKYMVSEERWRDGELESCF